MTISLIGAERAITEQIPPARRRFAVVAVVAVVAVGLAYGVSRLRTERCDWSASQFRTAWRDLQPIGDHLATDAPLADLADVAVASPTMFVAGPVEPAPAPGWCATAEGRLGFSDEARPATVHWALSTYSTAAAMVADVERLRATAPWREIVPLQVDGCNLVLATAAEPDAAPAPTPGVTTALADVLTRRLARLCRTW